MRVLHVANWASARVYKQVLSQQWDERGRFEVTLMLGSTPHVDLLGLVHRTMGWCSAGALRDVLRGFDCVVVHTTISTHDDAASFLVDHPIMKVWDCHDYINNEGADCFDAITCPSKAMAAKFGDKGHYSPSKVPSLLWPTWSEQEVDAVVFQGTMGVGEPWSDYSHLEAHLHRPVFFYTANDSIIGHEGCKIMQRLSYCKLLSALSQFSSGYAGAAPGLASVHDCVTNKFWEYIAAGLPIITHASDEMTKLAAKLDVCTRQHTRRGVREVIKQQRWQLSAESELDKLEGVYSGRFSTTSTSS